jgi:bacterial/archaeal transporter family protein
MASSTSKTSHTFRGPYWHPPARLGLQGGMLMVGWQLWAAGAAVLAALTAVLAKFGVEGIDSNLATLLRTVVVVVALTGLLAINGQLRWHQLVLLPRASLVALALSGLATGASWLCYFKALQLGPVARVAAIDKLSVVLIAVLGVWVLGEQLGPRGWIGVVLMAAGALLVALP